MKTLLSHLGVLTADELDAVSSSSPWLLAARVLRSGGERLLTWRELWDVLRWYAHNRGYDGNKAWSRQEEEAAAERDDTEKVKNACSLLEKYGMSSMAETWCAICGLDPLGDRASCALAGNDRPKAMNAAFPREVVTREVAGVLRAHVGKLPSVDAALSTALLTDWTVVPGAGIRLPGRYAGGLLFGQLVPRFDNRIIARCPITFERVYRETLADEGDDGAAQERAERLAKVPAADRWEFFRYRWAMQLANVQIAPDDGRRARRLTAAERRAVDERMVAAGGFTKGEFKKTVRELTGKAADNLDQMLLHPDAEKALVVDAVRRRLGDKALAPFVETLPAPLLKRLRGKLRRGKTVTLATVRGWLDDAAAFDAAVERELDVANTKKARQAVALTREAILARTLHVAPLSGRAPHSRSVMRDVEEYVFATDRHPAEEGGPLYRSAAIRAAQLQRRVDEQTNNHLVRHRLLVLDRLHRDLIKAYAADDPGRIARITIEVNRDLRAMSGKTNKAIEMTSGGGWEISNPSRRSSRRSWRGAGSRSRRA